MGTVSREKEEALRTTMKGLGIREKDIEEKFIRASGRGGQKVNKTATCVYVRHIPTGIACKCSSSRSQSLNRFFARRRLVEAIEVRQKGKASAAMQRIEKIRRQKKRRRRRAKKKNLTT